ncbi:hypothetical protein AAEO56_00965 [Flavobacterium sp. DGU11]|uniref:YhhN-like protein n=1 Tax=Flavobacterium arundinis TaxID=3139143 RepID=A0ABU9HSB9_9FLAO
MDLYALLNLLTWTSPFILLAGTITGVCYYKSLDSEYKTLVYYLFAMLCIDIGSRWCGLVFGNNLFFIPVLGFTEILLFSIVYYFIGFKNVPKLRYLLLIINSAALIFSVLEIFKTAAFVTKDFQLYSKAVNSLFIIVFAAIFFIQDIRKNKIPKKHIFILNSGILVFFSLNIIIFLPLDLLINENSVYKFYIWFTNLLLTLLFYSFLIYAIWKNGRIQGL